MLVRRSRLRRVCNVGSTQVFCPLLLATRCSAAFYRHRPSVRPSVCRTGVLRPCLGRHDRARPLHSTATTSLTRRATGEPSGEAVHRFPLPSTGDTWRGGSPAPYRLFSTPVPDHARRRRPRPPRPRRPVVYPARRSILANTQSMNATHLKATGKRSYFGRLLSSWALQSADSR